MATPKRRVALTDEERAERRRADREYAQCAVEQLQTSAGWQTWLQVRRRFRSYSFANQCLIALQCPHATRVAGFRAWLKLGYCVRRGERAIRMWVPRPPSEARLGAWERAGRPADQWPRTTFTLGPVFDCSQVAELPPPAVPVCLDPPIAPVEGDTLAWALAPLRGLAEEIGSTVTLAALPPDIGGSYDVRSRGITLKSAARSTARWRRLSTSSATRWCAATATTRTPSSPTPPKNSS